MDGYIVVTQSDGDVNFDYLDKHTLQKRLNEFYWGDQPRCLTPEEAKRFSDPNYWPENAILIIKGNVTVPIAKETITVYEV